MPIESENHKKTKHTAGAKAEHYFQRVTSSLSDADQEVKTNLSNSAVPRVLRALLHKIETGDYVPGQKINTVELAKELQLSRAPVREAIHILAGQGIVMLLPDRGAVLRPFDKQRLIDTLEIIECLFRVTLRKCALKIDESENRKIIMDFKWKIEEFAEYTNDFRFFLVLHDFHHELAQMSGNNLIDEMAAKLNLDLCARTFGEYVNVAREIPRYLQNYQRLIAALLAGDWRAAEGAYSYHIEWQVKLLKESKYSTNH